MVNKPIDPELKERAIMHLLPPYNWSLRQVADDIGASISTVHGWRQQLEMQGLIAENKIRLMVDLLSKFFPSCWKRP